MLCVYNTSDALQRGCDISKSFLSVLQILTSKCDLRNHRQNWHWLKRSCWLKGNINHWKDRKKIKSCPSIFVKQTRLNWLLSDWLSAVEVRAQVWFSTALEVHFGFFEVDKFPWQPRRTRVHLSNNFCRSHSKCVSSALQVHLRPLVWTGLLIITDTASSIISYSLNIKNIWCSSLCNSILN